MQFGGPHTKSHGVRSLSNHYHMQFDPEIGHDIFIICPIPCACAEFTYMLEKPSVRGFTPQQQPSYQPVINCTYWKALVSFNNWNIIKFPHKETTSEVFEDINQVVINGISDNMASFVKSGKYSAINEIDTTTMG